MTSQKVLGVKIDDINEEQAIGEISSWLSAKNKAKHLVVTVGPEFLVTASQDSEFKEILNQADLSLPDGFGLQIFSGIHNRVPGTDFMQLLCQQASEKGWSVGLLGGQEGIAAKTGAILRKKYPGLKINFTLDGAAADRIMGSVYSKTAGYSLPTTDLLFVALGHPKQEKFLVEASNYKVGMGVGGAFDYISGSIPRAPAWLRSLGLEWLYRLLSQPQRFKRIFNATIVYPWLLFTARI